MPAVVMENVSKSFAGRDVLRSACLAVDAGEILGLIGPNGSGKTTALRLLAGLASPDRGRVAVLGGDPARGGGRTRGQLGVLLEDVGFSPRLSPPQNLAFYGAL